MEAFSSGSNGADRGTYEKIYTIFSIFADVVRFFAFRIGGGSNGCSQQIIHKSMDRIVGLYG